MKLNVQDLIDQGLVRKKTYTEGIYKGLSVLKYHNKVFYDNLWHLDERLLECRGTIVDEDWNVIVSPFKKVFNLGENDTQIDPDLEVECPVKVNGFMLAVTNTEKYGLILSTTGTLDSEHVELGRKWVETLDVDWFPLRFTHLFEVVDKQDPHIIDENEGIYLIGIRSIENRNLLREQVLDYYTVKFGSKRPKVYWEKFRDLDLKVEHEGFLVRDSLSGDVLAKVKSSYYLVKKALIRMGNKRVDLMFNKPEEFKKQIDEEYYDLHKFVIDTYSQEEYSGFTQEQRRTIFEEYFND